MAVRRTIMWAGADKDGQHYSVFSIETTADHVRIVPEATLVFVRSPAEHMLEYPMLVKNGYVHFTDKEMG